MVSPRVVSLLPAATEALCAMGGERLLVGRSHECDVPRSIGHIPVLTAPRIRADADAAAIDRAVRDRSTRASRSTPLMSLPFGLCGPTSSSRRISVPFARSTPTTFVKSLRNSAGRTAGRSAL